MAVELATGYISLVPSARGIHQQISQELSGPLTRVSRDAGDRSSRAYSTGFQGGLRRATSGIAKTATLAFGGIGVALGAAGAFGLKAAGDFQQTRIAFEGILGSATKANTFLQTLRAFAAKTPFEFPELADAAKSLLAVGFNARDVIPVMTRLGNVAATLGVGGAEINGVVRALGQMKGKGKASAEELNQISEQIPGFSAIKAIAGELGITTAEAFKKMSVGAIDADTAVNAILKGMEKFPGAAGAMGRQSKTLNGVISTFKDTMRDALINGIEPLLPALSSGIEKIAPKIGKAVGTATQALAVFLPRIKDFAVGLSGAFDGFLNFVRGPLAGALKPLASAIGDLATSTAKFVRDAQPALKVFAVIAGAALVVSIRALAVVVQLLADNMTILGPVLATTGAAFAGFKVVKAVESGILKVAKAAGTAFGTMERWKGNVVSFGQTLGRFGSSLKSGVVSIVQWGKAALISAFNTVKQTAAFVAQKVASLAAAAAQKVLTAAQWLLNAAMSANPIVLVVAAIAALTAGVILAYQHFQPFHDAVDKAWQILQSLFKWVQANWPLLVAILTGPIGLSVLFIIRNFDSIKGVVLGVLNFVRSHWTEILAILTGPIGIAVLLISRNFDSIVGFFAGLPGRILAFAGSVGSAALAIGKAIINGIKEGITSAAGFVGDIASAFVDAIRSGWNTVARDINAFLPNSIGKGPFSINLPDNPIPTFAQGGVVSQPTFGILGENARTTPEIVSPVKLMADTFKAELKKAGHGPITIHTEIGVVNGVEDLDRHLDARDRKLVMALGAGTR